MKAAYYASPVQEFLKAQPQAVLGELAARHGHDLEPLQRNAWMKEIGLLQRELRELSDGWIAFEFSIPRMGKRADVVIIHAGIVFVLEFKIGTELHHRSAIDQVVDYALDLKKRELYATIKHRYPIVLRRDLEQVRQWLRSEARGSERFGLVASSGASRLKPEGINVHEKIDARYWFLNDRTDVRSSFYLEDPATEFDIQGLELDWIGVCWEANFRYSNGGWTHHRFRGTTWQTVANNTSQIYLANAYRVLLTRARQGMVIYVPRGDKDDSTRNPTWYEETTEFFDRCGIPATF